MHLSLRIIEICVACMYNILKHCICSYVWLSRFKLAYKFDVRRRGRYRQYKLDPMEPFVLDHLMDYLGLSRDYDTYIKVDRERPFGTETLQPRRSSSKKKPLRPLADNVSYTTDEISTILNFFEDYPTNKKKN